MSHSDIHPFFKGNTFPKSERLSSEILIKELFTKGSSFYFFPFKIVFLTKSGTKPNFQVLISVPKRSFKRAVDRNELKRKIREIYRLNKFSVFSQVVSEQEVYLGILYTAKEKLPFDILEKKLILALKRLVNNISVNE